MNLDLTDEQDRSVAAEQRQIPATRVASLMLKWSEVPWGTVITGVIAVYGAALGTFNLMLQRRRDLLAASDTLRRQAEQVVGPPQRRTSCAATDIDRTPEARGDSPP
jgi:hypothetical protein